MGKDFIDDDLMRDPRTPRLTLGLDGAPRDGFIPSSKDPLHRPLADLELTSLASRQPHTTPPPQPPPDPQLLALQNKQAEIEEERQLLEELYQKQKKFESDRAALRTIIERAYPLLDRAAEEVSAQQAEIEKIRALLHHATTGINAIREDDWEGTRVIEELDSAIAYFASTRQACQQALAHLPSPKKCPRPPFLSPQPDGFAAHCLRGFAFFLPLMLFLLALLLTAFFYFRHYA